MYPLIVESLVLVISPIVKRKVICIGVTGLFPEFCQRITEAVLIMTFAQNLGE